MSIQPTILIVDDTPGNLEFLKRLLSRQYAVELAVDGPQALKKITEHPPDLILLDIMMPNMPGYEVCRHLQADEHTRHIPVIFMSALDYLDDKIKGFEAGAVDYVVKPFQPQEVMARVKTHLALSQMRQELQEKNSQLEAEIVSRRQAEELLIRSEVKYRQVVDNMTSTILLFERESDGDYVLTNANASSRELTGQPASDLLGSSLADLLSILDLPQIGAAVDEVFASGKPVSNSAVTRQSRQIVRWLDITIYRISLNEFVLIVRDQTARKQTEEAALEHEYQTRLLEKETEFHRLKARITTRISHELRTPLTVINSSADLLARYGLDIQQEKFDKHIRKITDEIQHVAYLIGQILEIEDSTLSDTSFSPTTFYLDDLVQDVVEMYTHREEFFRTINFSASHQKIKAQLDKRLIRQALVNLLDNAFKFSPPDAPVDIDLHTDNRGLTIRIRDYGMGIQEVNTDRLFDVFERGANAGNVSGLGIGLSIVKRVVEIHEGTVHIQANPDRGITVVVCLPHQHSLPPV